jgi:hypothetical protein
MCFDTVNIQEDTKFMISEYQPLRLPSKQKTKNIIWSREPLLLLPGLFQGKYVLLINCALVVRLKESVSHQYCVSWVCGAFQANTLASPSFYPTHGMIYHNS